MSHRFALVLRRRPIRHRNSGHARASAAVTAGAIACRPSASLVATCEVLSRTEDDRMPVRDQRGGSAGAELQRCAERPDRRGCDAG